jgi:hypothetical protein
VETTETLLVTLNLMDDDRTAAVNDRKEHLRARMKEGWMPTSPAVSRGTGFVEGVDYTTLGYSAVVQWSGFLNGSPNANTGADIDLTQEFADMADGTRPELTNGQAYFVEVFAQTLCTSTGHTSRGAQRFPIQFTATQTVTNT